MIPDQPSRAAMDPGQVMATAVAGDQSETTTVATMPRVTESLRDAPEPSAAARKVRKQRHTPLRFSATSLLFHIVVMAISSAYFAVGSGVLPMTPLNSTYPMNVVMFCLNCVLIGAVIPLSGTLWIRTLLDLDTDLLAFHAWAPSLAYSAIIIVYAVLGVTGAWPDRTVMMPLMTGGAWYSPAISAAVYMTIPADIRAEPGFRTRFLYASSVPAVMNVAWFALCGFYITSGVRLVNIGLQHLRSHLVTKSVQRMTERQKVRLASLAAFEISAMTDVYIGLVSPRVNWYVWAALSVLQNVMLCSNLIQTTRWIRLRQVTLAAAGEADSRGGQALDELMIEERVSRYIFSTLSIIFRTVFFIVTFPILYNGPNAVWFHFTEAYAMYYYGKPAGRFTFSGRDLTNAVILSLLSVVPVLVNISWAGWYLRARLGRNLSTHVTKLLWVPVLRSLFAKPNFQSTAGEKTTGDPENKLKPKRKGSAAATTAVSSGSIAGSSSRFLLRATDDAYWKLLLSIYFILPIHPHSQLGRPWSVITYINDVLLNGASAPR
ncbi:hypothetical protein H9P43_003407 [Blastocladiella emersonii ATCC 22665]|nr:hypothetical protein H9P43_003407 [Blastocladiella emersonii ATCC 22665]